MAHPRVVKGAVAEVGYTHGQLLYDMVNKVYVTVRMVCRDYYTKKITDYQVDLSCFNTEYSYHQFPINLRKVNQTEIGD